MFEATSPLRPSPTGVPPIPEEEALTFLDIDPMTGFALSGHERLQLNLISNNNLAETGQDLMFLPVLWDDKTVHMTDKQFKTYKSYVMPAILWLKIIPFIIAALALLCGVLAVLLCVRLRKRAAIKSFEREPLIN